MIRWNDALDAEIARLRALGLSWGVVGEKMGISLLTVQRRAEKIGIPTQRLNHGTVSGARMTAGYEKPERYKTHHRKRNNQFDAELRRLRAAGVSWRSVAEKMGISPVGARQHAERIGIPVAHRHLATRGADPSL